MITQAIALLLPGTGLVIGLMFVLWLIHLRMGNASIVDPGWAYGLAIMALTFALLGPGYFWRRWLMAGMALAWGLRLGTYLLLRILGKEEEGRYQELRRRWKTNLKWKFLLFFQFQAVLVIFLSLPFLLAALNTAPAISALEMIGAALWLAALAGESTADRQLAAFKRDIGSSKQVCQRGLWAYSRHPNYFFEWLVWVAWAIFAAASPWGWVALLCPLLMLYLLFRVTGIPATEQQALSTKGDAYRLYQQATSAFVPWFHKPAPIADNRIAAR